MLNGSLVQLREPKPPTVIPLGYDVNAHYEFHSREPNHTIENCKALKHKVRNLLDAKAITFTSNGPNINNNLMPPYSSPSISMLEEYGGKKMVSIVDSIKTPLATVKEQLLMN